MSEVPDGPGFDLLAAPPPALSPAVASEIVREDYGEQGQLTSLASERDQNFRVQRADGTRAVLKISNAREPAAFTAFQSGALLHLEKVGCAVPVPRLLASLAGQRQVTVRHAGVGLTARLFSFLEGDTQHGAGAAGSTFRYSMGETLAGLGRGLRGYYGAGGDTAFAWNIAQATQLEPLLGKVPDAGMRGLLAGVVEGFAVNVGPQLATLRAQPIHNDFNPHNVLVTQAGDSTVGGVIDFGDLVHAPLVADVAVALAYQLDDADDPFQGARQLLAGYESVCPLEREETALLFELARVRIATTLLIAGWRAERFPANRDYILRSTAKARALLQRLAPWSADEGTARLLAGDEADRLASRRRQAMGPAYRLFYDQPLHLVRGKGVWLYDRYGRRYLDAYNNVAHVGHCHPRVSNAILAQARRLNTHTRYLHANVVTLAERLTALLPESLTTAMFACSGSEANELALRIARAVTGGSGVIVTEFAYHGTGVATFELSTDSYPATAIPAHIATFALPGLHNPQRGERQAADLAAGVREAIRSLHERGVRPAALILDTAFASEGVLQPPRGFLRAAADAIRAAGGLFIADEVQAGFGRLGAHFWGFEFDDVVPDIVTMGKPMGNGQPISALVTTAAHAGAFADCFGYFNTFGGNPVSAAAALAVLDVLVDEGLQANSTAAGLQLKKRLADLQRRFGCIAEVRGRGLFCAVEFVDGTNGAAPDADRAAGVVEALRERGVLANRTGRDGNVLKLRPPLVFNDAQSEQLVTTLAAVLSQSGG